MYNEIIFNELKELYLQVLKQRENNICLSKDDALVYVQNKYSIQPIKQLSDNIESKIDNLKYFDCQHEFDKNKDSSVNIAKNNNGITSHQAMIDRKNNKCFCNFDLKVLSHHFYLLSEICNENILYKNILQNLTAHLCNGDYYNFNKESVTIFFDYAIDLYLLKGDTFVDNTTSKVIFALNKFNLINEEDFKINMSRVELINGTEAKIHKDIENNVKKLGGYKTAKMLFEVFLNKVNDKFDRYLIFRNRNGFAESQTPIPFQYLLHIACKDLSDYKQNNISKNDVNLFNCIIEKAVAYVDLLEIFNSNPWSEINASSDSLPYLVKNNILLESLCFPIQYACLYVKDLLHNLYIPFAQKVSTLSDIYSYRSFYLFIKYLLGLKPCSCITSDELSKCLRINKNIVKKYLEYFSTENTEINNNYTEAFKDNNLYDKPLIKLSDDTYFWLCSQFCCYSFLKVLYEDIQKNYCGSNKKNLPKKFGMAIENYVYKLLDNKNIKYKHGIYFPSTNCEGECDLILENEERLVFLELKNSGIAREFQFGDDVKVLNQLGNSTLKAQCQILKHKIHLSQNGNKLDLFASVHDVQPACQIDINNKRVFSISLCGAEALFFTSGYIANNLISSLAYTKFSTRDGDESLLQNINSTAEEIRNQVKEYAKNFTDITLRDIFHYSTVKSLQQFWFALKYGNSLDELIENLVHDTWMQNYSGDFYVNLIQHLELRKHKNSSNAL